MSRDVRRRGGETWALLSAGLALTALLALVAGGGRLVTPLAVREVVDDDFAQGTVDRVLPLAIVGVLVAGAASWAMHRRLVDRIETALAALRDRGLARVHELEPTTLDRTRGADLVGRLTADLDLTTSFVQAGGVQLLTHTAQMVVAAAVMFWWCPPLTVAFVLIAIVLLVGMRSLQRVVARRFAVVRDAVATLQDEVTEASTGITVIRATGTEGRSVDRLVAAVDATERAQRGTLATLHLNTSFGEIAISTMTALAVVGGTAWALGPVGPLPALDLTAGEIVALVFLVTFFVRPLQGLVQSLGEAQNAIVGWRRAEALAATPSAARAGGPSLGAGPLAVAVRGVDVAYGDAAPVVTGLDLDLAPGEHVAVVGRTGSGKSTVAKLLTRQLSPVAGTVLVQGVPLADVADTALARRVAIVPQDPFLFDLTVAENIAVGLTDAPAGAVEDVVEALDLTGWVAGLPDGLDTRVGSRGDRLSVGERQLVALARTALVDPDLLVLDEATSGVDPATDVRVQTALDHLTRGRTTVTIAHRLASARRADRVLVMADGRLAQSGPHADLVDAPGPYAALYATWAADERPLSTDPKGTP